MSKVTKTMEHFEFWRKWITSAVQMIVIPVGIIAYHYVEAKLEEYGRRNFASQAQVQELKTSIDTMNVQLVKLNSYVDTIPKNYWTREEQHSFSIDAIRSEASLASELKTMNSQLATVSSAITELKQEVRSKRTTQ